MQNLHIAELVQKMHKFSSAEFQKRNSEIPGKLTIDLSVANNAIVVHYAFLHIAIGGETSVERRGKWKSVGGNDGNVAVNGGEMAVNDGNVAGKMAGNGGNVAGKMAEKIMELIKVNPEITVPELSENVGIPIRTIERKIQKLQKENRLKRIGGANGGQWEVLE